MSKFRIKKNPKISYESSDEETLTKDQNDYKDKTLGNEENDKLTEEDKNDRLNEDGNEEGEEYDTTDINLFVNIDVLKTFSLPGMKLDNVYINS